MLLNFLVYILCFDIVFIQIYTVQGWGGGREGEVGHYILLLFSVPKRPALDGEVKEMLGQPHSYPVFPQIGTHISFV